MSVTKEEIDDLDDLDDLLDDFDESALPPAPETISSSATDPSHTGAAGLAPLPDLGSDDFARQLQMGMEDLMKELDSSPEARKDFEQLMTRMDAATIDPFPAPPTSYPNNPRRLPATSSGSAAASDMPDNRTLKTPKDFQASIEANLQRMKDSESVAAQSALDSEGTESDAFMAEMMKQFQDSAGGDGDFGSVLEGMMSQLMSKEILYDPLLELHQKYPAWLADHPTDAKFDEYKQQAALVREIIEKFDDREYRDEDKEKKEEVMELMGRMQELGSPPKDIMGDNLGLFDPENKMPTGDDCSIM